MSVPGDVMDFVDLRDNALSTLAKLQRIIEQDDILVVPSPICSDGFSSRSTVGIMLQGMVIDNMLIGGPAYDSGLMRSEPCLRHDI